jgi:hypothetical protein
VVESDASKPPAPNAGSAFVPLPRPHSDVLRVLGPRPEAAAVAVDPLTKLDQPLTVVQSFVAGLCDPEGRLVRPVELMLAVDPATVVPNKQVPTAALLRAFAELPELLARLSRPAGTEPLQQALLGPWQPGPLLYCRKRQCVFAARSPDTGRPLRIVPADQVAEVKAADGDELAMELLIWDGPSAGDRTPNVYAGRGGSCSLGVIKSLDELLLDQGRVVGPADEASHDDRATAGEHACVECPEHQRCYPPGDGYVYAADRLVTLSAADAPVVFRPLGAWRFDEAARMVGGLPPGDCLAARERADNDFEAWVAGQARAMETAGPARLLMGETDGRELLEVARLKLGMIADILAQLEEVWQVTGRPYLCWNEESVRVSWQQPAAIPAVCWGFRSLLRKVGLQPAAPFETPDGQPLCYPPAFSDAAYLPPPAVDAARYFDEPRSATLFVKAARSGDETVGIKALLEELGIPWELFRTGDALHVVGPGWRALLAPAAERNPDDGEGLPFSGQAEGDIRGLKKGEQVTGVECRWYPRFEQAVDLHAVGMLMFEALVAHDERSIQSFREQMAAEIGELTTSCRGLPVEQRDEYARNWVTERCEADAPAAVWTRRNLLQRRDDRNATRLDAFGAPLWQEIMTFGLRLTTGIPGFSYCADRGCAAPRVGGGLLLPLVELHGLLALLDDQIFGRTAPGAAVRAAFKG